MTTNTPLPAKEAEPLRINIMPDLSEDQQRRVAKAIERRNEADYQSFMKLQELNDD